MKYISTIILTLFSLNVMAADDDGTGQPSQYIIDSCNHILSANDNSTGNKATDDGSGNKSTDNYVLYLNCINDLAEAE